MADATRPHSPNYLTNSNLTFDNFHYWYCDVIRQDSDVGRVRVSWKTCRQYEPVTLIFPLTPCGFRIAVLFNVFGFPLVQRFAFLASSSAALIWPPYRHSEISGVQIIRTPASANIDFGSGGTYQITVGIERVQKTRLIWPGTWLNLRQCVLVYKK
jgi:hypothetical protein